MPRPSLYLGDDLAGLTLLFRGKVRDVYALDDDLLLVATDRVSAYDSVLPGGVPGKGEVLTRLTAWWLRRLEGLVPHHLLGDDPAGYPEPAPRHARVLAGRSMWARRADPIPVECVVRGRLAGSALREYQESGAVGGEPLPPGLRPGQVLDPPLFTPATKAQQGHDENIGFRDVVALLGEARATALRDASVRVFRAAVEHAASRGLVLVDTKFEFGVRDGRIILIDEVLTPDSSRYWLAETVRAGASPVTLDKQYIRDYLDETGWNHEPPAPPLPAKVVRRAQDRYRQAFERLTGQRLDWEDTAAVPPSEE